jgi:hypothetical protein
MSVFFIKERNTIQEVSTAVTIHRYIKHRRNMAQILILILYHVCVCTVICLNGAALFFLIQSVIVTNVDSCTCCCNLRTNASTFCVIKINVKESVYPGMRTRHICWHNSRCPSRQIVRVLRPSDGGGCGSRDLAASAVHGSLESGGRFCGGASGMNLP